MPANQRVARTHSHIARLVVWPTERGMQPAASRRRQIVKIVAIGLLVALVIVEFAAALRGL